MKFTELEGIPKSLLKKKRIPFYKAYPFLKEGEEMKVNENIDLLALTPEAAVEKYLKDIDLNEFAKNYQEIFASIMGFGDKKIIGESNLTYQDFYINFGDKGNPDRIKMHNLLVPFAVILVSTEDLKTIDLVDVGDDYFQNDVVAITLKDKDIKIDLEELRFISFDMTVDANSGKRVISNVELKEKE